MIHTKFTFNATIIFQGEVEELPSVKAILDMLVSHELDIEYIDLENTIGDKFVIMIKPKGQKVEETASQEDIPF